MFLKEIQCSSASVHYSIPFGRLGQMSSDPLLESWASGGDTMVDLLLYLILESETDNPYSSIKTFKAVGNSSEYVSATACSMVVSEFPTDAGLGFFLCFKISGLGMIDPDARLPRVTLTFDPSSRYLQDTLTGALVTGSIKLTLE